jgi:hypothetical protein
MKQQKQTKLFKKKNTNKGKKKNIMKKIQFKS